MELVCLAGSLPALVLRELGLPFVGGAFLNIYNARSLRLCSWNC